MLFEEVANLFQSLEKTSKRLEKTMILRDFYWKYPEESPKIFDMISGNYQRKIGKKTLGISTKTIIEVLHFVSKMKTQEIEKSFNEKGDIGLVSQNCFTSQKQTSLQNSKLKLEDIFNSFDKISNKTGSNSNKFKKEILTQLFISANKQIEYKFLARLLVDDLRIGVSEGVIREAVVNSLFPKLIDISMICSKCKYISISSQKCFSCGEKIDTKNQKKIAQDNFEIHQFSIPKNTIGLDSFIETRNEDEQLAYILRNTKKEEIILIENPRELYNSFLKSFERQYNCLNNFEIIIDKIKNNLEKVLDVEIELHNPVLSMLGTRANSINEAVKYTGVPALFDYKYDGLRVQIHNDKGEVTLFSRNLENITKQFPEIITYIKKNFSDLSFVLDSECVGYNKEKKTFLPFQTLSRRILTKNYHSVSNILVVVKSFDILYLNEKTLLDEKYVNRREIMENIFIGRELEQEVEIN